MIDFSGKVLYWEMREQGEGGSEGNYLEVLNPCNLDVESGFCRSSFVAASLALIAVVCVVLKYLVVRQ